MTLDNIVHDFREKVCDQVRITQEGVERYRVFTPFLFEDGDHLAIVLRRDNSKWVLSDEGHTYMHLTYDIEEKDLQKGTRQKIISNALSSFKVEDCNGELVLAIQNDQYGDALYSFAQALLKITDVAYLSREGVRSTFMEDFRTLMTETVPEPRRRFDWHDPARDEHGIYSVDCRVNGIERPLFVFALPGDDKTRDARFPCSSMKSGECPFAVWLFSRTKRTSTAKYLHASAMSARSSSQASVQTGTESCAI